MEGDSSQSGINNNWRLYFAHAKENVSDQIERKNARNFPNLFNFFFFKGKLWEHFCLIKKI